MRLSEICIEKPVLTTVLSLVLIMIGFLGYQQLELRAQPKVFRPSLHVMVSVPGSSAEFVEKNVVIPLENRLQQVDHLSLMESTSSQGFAEVHLRFANISQQDFLSSQSQVMQAVSQTHLPDNAEQPQIRMAGSHSNQIMVVAVSSTTMGQQRLVDYVQNQIVRRLQQTSGVGDVEQWSTEDALRINLLPDKMAQLSISVQQVIDALKANNISIAAGQVVNAEQTIPVNLQSRLASVAEFQQMIISHRGNHYIHLKDIANIAIDKKSYAGAYTYYNDKQGVAVSINAADNANPIALGKVLRRTFTQLQQQMPPGTTIHLLYDQTEAIEHSVNEVFLTIFESIFLVALVTLLFLGRWRFAIVPIVTIPVCIIAGFAVMWLLGFTINMMTLLALVLAVGLVVDDAIVVLENCHRYVEQGLSPWKAAIQSMKQITFPVIGMTISIVAVYVPVLFMGGKTAVYFQEFAFTMAGAVVISGFVALTLTPMMCARLMSKTQGSGYDAKLDAFFSGLRRRYTAVLAWTLKNRWLAIFVFVVLAGMGGWVLSTIPNTLLPKEYGGYMFVGVSTPDSSSVAYTEKRHRQVFEQLLKMPEVDNLMSFGGGSGNDGSFGATIIRLKPAYSSYAKNIEVAEQVAQQFQSFVGAKVFASPMNLSSHEHDDNAQEGQIAYRIVGFTDYPELVKEAARFTTALNNTGEFQQVDNRLRYSSQQYDISLNRQKIQQLGIKITDVTTAVSTFLGGYTMQDGYQFAGVNYPIIVQLPVEDMVDLQVLNNIYLSNSEGAKIALGRVLTVKPVIGLPERAHINGMRSGDIIITPKSGQTLGQVTSIMQQIAKQTFSPGISLAYSQQVVDMKSGNTRMLMIFILGLIFIYLVLGALFESFIDPLIILFTVPLCIVGALIALKLIGGSLNIYTIIGLVTLIGLVAKHGVLITQFANQIREQQGKPIIDSVLEAASIRIRPILMTTATMVVGAVPLVFATGVGSNSHSQIGWVIIAGLLVGTVFSLFMVPVAYTLFARFKRNHHQNR